MMVFSLGREGSTTRFVEGVNRATKATVVQARIELNA
jgi:hypothetical protein